MWKPTVRKITYVLRWIIIFDGDPSNGKLADGGW